MMRRSIAAMGTSLTGGISVRPWANMLATTLGVGRAEVYSVVNFGVSGSQSADRLNDMAPVLFARPDIAILEFTMNDAYAPYCVSTAQCRDRTMLMIDALRSQDEDIRIALLIMNPCVAGSESALARQSLPDYTDVYRTLAGGDPGLVLVDTWNSWGVPTFGDLPDGIHPPLIKYRQIVIPALATAL